MTRLILFMLLIVALAAPSMAQQPASAELWRMAPSNALVVAGFDARPGNASMQAIDKVQTQETRDAMVKQQADLRKAAENLALLFGVSLDWAKDIESWSDQQWALVLMPEGEKSVQPVILIGSKDAPAARAAMDKLLAPWQRLGELTGETEGDWRISSFKMKDYPVGVYASAVGPVVAVSPSRESLVQVLKGGGFAAGSAGEQAMAAVSGSAFYAYMDPAVLKMCGVKTGTMPLAGLGLGVSVVETGVRLRVVGLPTEQGAKFLSALLLPPGGAQQTAALTANAGIPSTSLVQASFPTLSTFSALAAISGLGEQPLFAAVQEIGDTQISGVLTAALPYPAGFVSAMAISEQAAVEKLPKIVDSLKKAKLTVTDAGSVSGVKAWKVPIKRGPTIYLAQIGQHIVVASDGQSLGAAAATIKGEQPALAESATYKETMAGLENSNLLTLYANLAPVQGVGYLASGLGLSEWPVYGTAVKWLQNMQALGLGAGYDGKTLNATLFLRAKPEVGPTIGPAVVGGTAIGAAVLFPVFARAREAARISQCASNLKQLVVAAQMYASDHNGKLPPMIGWQEELETYLEMPLPEMECPCGEAVYAFNKNLGGSNLGNIKQPEELIMFFEADPDLPNRTGSRANAILPHGGTGFFAYVDGRVAREHEVPAQSHWVAAKPAPVKKAPAKKAPAPVKKHK